MRVSRKVSINFVNESLRFSLIRKGVASVPEESRKIVEVPFTIFLTGLGFPFGQSDQVYTKICHRRVRYASLGLSLAVVAADGGRGRVQDLALSHSSSIVAERIQNEAARVTDRQWQPL